MKLIVNVATPQEVFIFSCVAHHTTLQHERLVESGFYEEYSASHTVPISDHHELELDTPVWEHVHAARIHWHQNRFTGRYFVCVTTSLPTLAAAKGLFEIWCLGTAYTMLTGEDFNPLVQHGDMARFRDELKKRGIEVVKE